MFYDGANHAAVWPSVNEYRIIDLGLENEDGMKGSAAAISPDGRYALICVNTASAPKIAVYDVTNGNIEEVPVKDAFEVSGYVIDNNGNFFCSIMDDKTYTNKTYYWYAAGKTLIDMNYYVQQFAPGAEDLPDMSTAHSHRGRRHGRGRQRVVRIFFTRLVAQRQPRRRGYTSRHRSESPYERHGTPQSAT